ncbi:hypothetical protein LBMAG44_14000 [Gemmatimonadota bacterium]|nr:hypothetical protein LBMAG44_14000 [Gemmatimonadota bacterium]
MIDPIAKVFNDFDRGTISRRQLLQALGVAAVAAPLSNASAQGSCGAANAGTPRCNTTLLPPPFAPTGWKTIHFDHFKLQCAEPRLEAAYYATLMNWKVRSDDGDKIVLDIGDNFGAVEIRGGYVAPPAPTPAPAAPPAGAGDSSAGRGGRGAGAAAGGRGGARIPLRAVWDSFCWGIDNWDTKKVEAALTERGLNPVADHNGKDFQSFHVKDPDGFDVQISNGSKQNRRTAPAKGALPAPAPFAPTTWKTLWLDHISFGVTDYKESAAFYNALLGWKLGADEGSQNTMEIGPEIGGIIVRGGNRFAPEGQRAAGGRGGQASVRRASMGHISFGISGWDAAGVKAELDKRGLTGRADTGGRGDILTAPYQSYHTTTPNGYDLQIGNRTRFDAGGGDR